MAIAINGAGTITGVSVGGLPDGCIAAADIASGVVPAAGADTSLSNLSATGDGLVCQAWVVYDQKTTAMAVVDSGGLTGVSAVADMGVGKARITFSSTMTNATYAISGIVDYGADTTSHVLIAGYKAGNAPSSRTTSLFYVTTIYSTNVGEQDCEYIALMVFGD